MKKISINKNWIIVIIFLLTCIPQLASAQDDPCVGTDPFGNACGPIDSWVIILAAATLLFAVWHLYHQQKATKAR